MKALEADISVTLAILRRHINPLQSPLYRLPPDLFPEIASHLASETDLVNATHVSYHTRNTLLSHPGLWSHLNFEHEMRARMFFELSGQMPLHIDMVRDSTKMAGLLAELRQQSNRIATLKLHLWPVQKMFLSEHLPSLRRLEIFNDCCHDLEEKGWDAIWTPVWGPVKTATSWSFPSLTSFIIHDLRPIPVFAQNLTCFKLRAEESVIDTDELLDFLGSCPLLEHIDVFHVHEPLRGKRDLVVSLPSLHTYTQTTIGEESSPAILDALSLPSFCSVTFRSRDGILPSFDSSHYLAEVKRMKLGTTVDTSGNEVAEALELINIGGTKVCSERVVDPGVGENRNGIPRSRSHALNAAHLISLENIDGRSVEILCIDGCVSQAGMGAVDFFVEALGFGNVRTLILSRSSVWPCLSAVDEESGASALSEWFSLIHTLIIRPDAEYYLGGRVLWLLLGVAQKRKKAGFPLGSVSLFLCDDPAQRRFRVLEELRACVGELEVVMGDDVLDWDVDKYFLDGLDHLQKDRNVQWD